MAIVQQATYAAVYELDGADRPYYEAVRTTLGFPPHAGAGMVMHWLGDLGDALLIADVWTDKATYDRFFIDRLAPAIEQAVAAGPARPDVMPRDARVLDCSIGPRAREFVGTVKDDREGPVLLLAEFDSRDTAGFESVRRRAGGPSGGPDDLLAHGALEIGNRSQLCEIWRNHATAESAARQIDELLSTRRGDTGADDEITRLVPLVVFEIAGSVA